MFGVFYSFLSFKDWIFTSSPWRLYFIATFGDTHVFLYDSILKHTLDRGSALPVDHGSTGINLHITIYWYSIRFGFSLISHLNEYISMQVRHVFFLLCQFVNYMEVTKLPVYYPSQQEKDDPKLYAENVRRLMAHEVWILIWFVSFGVYGQWIKWIILLCADICFCIVYYTLLMHLIYKYGQSKSPQVRHVTWRAFLFSGIWGLSLLKVPTLVF